MLSYLWESIAQTITKTSRQYWHKMKLSPNTSAEGTMVALRSDDDQLEPEGLIFWKKKCLIRNKPTACYRKNTTRWTSQLWFFSPYESVESKKVIPRMPAQIRNALNASWVTKNPNAKICTQPRRLNNVKKYSLILRYKYKYIISLRSK